MTDVPAADGQLAGLVQHLQMRHRTLDGENQSLQQLIVRLRADLEATSSRANEAERARLEAAERLRDSLRNQEHQQRLMQQVQELNLLRESNVTLRSDAMSCVTFWQHLAVRHKQPFMCHIDNGTRTFTTTLVLVSVHLFFCCMYVIQQHPCTQRELYDELLTECTAALSK